MSSANTSLLICVRLQWNFVEPVIVTKVVWTYTHDKSSRSGGVEVTGSSGGQAFIESGEVQTRTADWGTQCEDCPKVGHLVIWLMPASAETDDSS